MHLDVPPDGDSWTSKNLQKGRCSAVTGKGPSNITMDESTAVHHNETAPVELTSLVKLMSSDGQEFSCSKQVACQSNLIKLMLEDIGDDSEEAIPLANVTGRVLTKVIEFAEHHKDDPPPAPEKEDEFAPKSCDDIEDWDRDFMNLPQQQVFDIMLAANYLDIKKLLDLGKLPASMLLPSLFFFLTKGALGCKTVALSVKGKTVQEIRDIFQIENDFTPEEEEQIRKENEWCADA